MQFSKSMLIAALAIAVPVIGHSSPITSNPSLSIGGYDFSQFTCSVSKGGIYATPNNCGQINVNTITSPGTGIQFSSGFLAAPLSFDDAVLSYHVASTAGIDKVNLDFNGTFWGFAIASVTESVFDGSKLVGFAEVTCGKGVGCSRSDDISLGGIYHNLYIEKDINVTGITGVAEASAIDQTFALSPEPSSMALLGSGALALAAGLFRRSRRSAQKA